jgi:hypothetical protein
MHEIIATTTFNNEMYAQGLEFDETLGFICEPPNVHSPTIRVLGFVMTHNPSDLRTILHSTTNFAALGAEEQSVDRQGKGVGLRLYNTPQGPQGLREYAPYVGAYSIQLGRDHIVDTRCTSDDNLIGKARLIGRQLGVEMRARRHGVEAAIEAVHQKFPIGTQGVLYNQPPHAALRAQKRRAQTRQTALQTPSSFMVIRDATLALTRQGEVALDAL